MSTSHLINKRFVKHHVNQSAEVYPITKAHSNVLNDCYFIDDLPCYITPHTDVYSGFLRPSPSDENTRAVVIKVWRLLSQSPDQRMGFCSALEIRVERWQRAASIHPNFAHPLGIISSRIGGLPALVVPHYEVNLQSHLHGLHGTSSANRLAETTSMMASIGDALLFLHSQAPPIIHGGLRCSNILVSKAAGSNTPIPLLTDVGLADLPYPTDFTLTNFNENLKAFRWMAPELLFGRLNSEVSATFSGPTTYSDIYSFGMTFLEALTGHQPFMEHRSIFTVILMINAGARPSKPAILCLDDLPGCPILDDLWTFLSSCWMDNPRRRPPSGIPSERAREFSVRASML